MTRPKPESDNNGDTDRGSLPFKFILSVYFSKSWTVIISKDNINPLNFC